MCTPCFCPSLRHQQSSSSGGPAPRQRHSTGILTVRRPRETIPVNFRVVVNFDIAIDAAKSSGGRIGRVSGVSRTGFFFAIYPNCERRHPGPKPSLVHLDMPNPTPR